MKRLLFFLLMAISQQSLYSQEVVFEASAPQVVEVGERFRLTFTVNTKPSTFQQPVIQGFNVIAGPSQTSSTNTKIINGQVSQSFALTYTYILQADKEGKFKIGTSEIEVNGKTYTTAQFEIEVIKDEANSSNQQKASSNAATGAEGDLFVRVEISKSSVYLGEALVATVKFYARGVAISNFEDIKFPSFNGFWSQEIETPTQITLQRESVNGKIYNSGLIKKWLLFPQQKGKIKIEPCILDCIIQVKANGGQNIFDSFYDTYQTVKKRVVSQVSVVDVKDLPANHPASFEGAVGHFTVESSIDRTSLMANEAATYRVKISGNGNLKLISAPKMSFPPDFESYDPKIVESIKSQSSGSAGYKVFEYPLIPRSAGDFSIPGYEFTFFNPQTGSYSTVRTKAISVKVNPDPNGNNRAVTTGGVSKQDLKVLGQDIKYISIQNQSFKGKNELLISSWWYYLNYILITILAVLAWFYLEKRYKVKSNLVLYKNSKANKIAKKRLKNAAIALKLNNSDTYFEELHKAILGYLSDKLGINAADLTAERAAELLKEKQVQEATISGVMEVISICEFARYAPSASIERREEVYQNAVELVSNMEQTIR